MKANTIPQFNNFRELLNFSYENYKDRPAYKYKVDPSAKEIEYVVKTYDDFYNDTKKLATALLNKDFDISRVALIGNNRYEWVVSYFSVLNSGNIIAPIDKMLPNNEIESLVRRSKVKVAIFDSKYLDTFKALKADKDCELETLICMDDIDDSEVLYLNDLIDFGKSKLDEGDTSFDEVELDNSKMSIMLFTSGTTNLSKIVMLSQNNILSNIYAYQFHFRMYSNDRLLSFLPIHHTFESSITIIYGFSCGVCVCFSDGLKHIQKNLQEYQITIFVAVPILLEAIYKRVKKAIKDNGKEKSIKKLINLSEKFLKVGIDLRKLLFKPITKQFGGKVRIVLYGGAALDADSIRAFNRVGIKSIQGYGLTETSPVVVSETETKTKPGSAGITLDNVEIKIDNPDADGVGEILVKGPNVMLGYYENEEATKNAFKDGYFRTGDFGYIDDEDFLFITGRKNDIIVLKNGKNIYPQEIEFLINKFPYVLEAMVFSRDESKTDTMLVAKIVYDKDVLIKEHGDIKESEFEKAIFEDIKKMNKTLPVYKHIKKIIITDEPMEKTSSQKIKRYQEIKNINNNKK